MEKELKDKEPQIFLGGEVQTDWREEIIDEFADTLTLIDPVDEDWEPEENIYEELADMLVSDEVVFFKGGEGTEKEKEFLDKVGEDYEEFDDLNELEEHLEDIEDIKDLEDLEKDKETTYTQPENDKEASSNHKNNLNIIKAAIEIPLEIGDEILTGKFKNRRTEVKTIGKDDKNHPTVNGRPLLNIRIPKLMKNVISCLKSVGDLDYGGGCIYIPVPDELRRIVLKEIAPEIEEGILKKDESNMLNGVETDTHATLLFGTSPNLTAEELRKYFTEPITVRSSDTIEYFDNSEHGNSVAIIPVESEKLTELHEVLKENIENKDSYDIYKPHITIAYLELDARLDIEKIEPFAWEVNKLIMSKKDGGTQDVWLEGKEPETEGVEVIGSVLKEASTLQELENLGAEIVGDQVTLYRGGDVSEEVLRNLRYNDYLSTVLTGVDAMGNAGADSYGKNVIEITLPISDVEVVHGEVQYRGESESLKKGKKYPPKIYLAYNDYYGSNYTAEEIDKQDNVREVASQGLSGGREEFDELMAAFNRTAGIVGKETVRSAVKNIKKAFDENGYAYGLPPQVFDINRDKYLGNLGDNYDLGDLQYMAKDYYNEERMEKRIDNMMNLYDQEISIDETIEEKSQIADEAGDLPVDDDIAGKDYESYISKTIGQVKNGFKNK